MVRSRFMPRMLGAYQTVLASNNKLLSDLKKNMGTTANKPGLIIHAVGAKFIKPPWWEGIALSPALGRINPF